MSNELWRLPAIYETELKQIKLALVRAGCQHLAETLERDAVPAEADEVATLRRQLAEARNREAAKAIEAGWFGAATDILESADRTALDAAIAEAVEPYKADAERYRFVESTSGWAVCAYHGRNGWLPIETSAIDAARGAA